jgi:spore maturation protein CgeB
MKIAYHQPSLYNVFAWRQIFLGIKHACQKLNIEFVVFTAGMDLQDFLEQEQPTIFVTWSHFFFRKQLDYHILHAFRKSTGKLCTWIGFWNSPHVFGRINLGKGVSQDKMVKDLIQDDLLGDLYFCPLEQWDPRMDGFASFAGKQYHTVPLAADDTVCYPDKDPNYCHDIVYIGAYQEQKKEYFRQNVFPMGEHRDLMLLGRDWTFWDRQKSFAHKIGQYYNIPYLNQLQQPTPKEGEERKLYSSSHIMINVHEDYQRELGGDCNDRTFRVPACGGLIINDNVLESIFVMAWILS